MTIIKTNNHENKFKQLKQTNKLINSTTRYNANSSNISSLNIIRKIQTLLLILFVFFFLSFFAFQSQKRTQLCPIKIKIISLYSSITKMSRQQVKFVVASILTELGTEIHICEHTRVCTHDVE